MSLRYTLIDRHSRENSSTTLRIRYIHAVMGRELDKVIRPHVVAVFGAKPNTQAVGQPVSVSYRAAWWPASALIVTVSRSATDVWSPLGGFRSHLIGGDSVGRE
jgi:hypothetical protein